MLRKPLLFGLAITIQIVILLGIIGRFEYIRATGQTLYIELTGYDPTDLFRGDYVNLAYRMSTSPDLLGSGRTSLYGSVRYIVPKITNGTITGIGRLETEKPSDTLSIEAKDLWIDSRRDIVIRDNTNSHTYNYPDTSCNMEKSEKYTAGSVVYYNTKYQPSSETLGYITASWDETDSQSGTIVSIGNCESNLRFRTSSADKFFVPEGEGMTLQEKIQKGGMYAKWKVGTNGAVIIEDVVPHNQIGK